MDEIKNARRSKLGRSLAVVGMAAGVLGIGCLTRPVQPGEPTTKTNIVEVIKQQAVDKLDILFMIDNSASMGDKQDLLKEAVPDLVSRLLTPDCENQADKTQHQKPTGTTTLTCPDGWQLEFPPVHDMHIGIVTSSLGGGGATDICEAGSGAPAPPVGNRHDNDQGRLINRTKPASGTTEPPVLNAKPLDNNGGNFLAWLPPGEPKNQGKPDPNVTKEPDAATFIKDFQDLAVGVQEYGCGLEAQLESWYRFLVQPDPYDTIKLDASQPAKASLEGFDATILKQRKDFLRSDSLVAVIMLTDEEDSWSDPLALGGRGWTTRTRKFPGSPFDGTLAKPTSECLDPVDVNNPLTTGPNNPNCTSCGFTGNKANGTAISADPNCQASCGASCAGYYTAAEDGLNVRYTNDMKRRYGFDPQFPVQRYIDGLRSLKVPNRDGEHPGGGGSYKGTKNCTNPLFAKDLPDGSNLDPAALCNLGLGQRTPDLIFFAIIGGVPWQLLLEDPNNTATSAFKNTLVDSDWTKILGKDPSTYQADGIDPHMIESITPRAGLPDPTASDTADPIHGREWKTSLSYVKIDLQYACTFPLPVPKDCTLPANSGACDCVDTAAAPQGPPVCGTSPRTTQVRGKAYPTIRELRVAKGMGPQGVVASLCPRNVTDKNSPDYGYRPAVRTIIDRLKAVLAGQCLPQTLAPNPDGTVPCLVILTFDQPGACDTSKGLTELDPDILKRFNDQRLAELRQTTPAATLADLGAACQLAQIIPTDFVNGTCESVTKPGWCYVEGAAAGTCPQAIKFSATGQPPSGSKVNLSCIETRAKADGG
jgi:hypothetical protein